MNLSCPLLRFSKVAPTPAEDGLGFSCSFPGSEGVSVVVVVVVFVVVFVVFVVFVLEVVLCDVGAVGNFNGGAGDREKRKSGAGDQSVVGDHLEGAGDH